MIEIKEKPLDIVELGTIDVDSIYKSDKLKAVVINGERVLMYE